MGTMKQTNTTAATWQARQARAIAYLQEKPAKGQGWTQKKTPYVYDREETNGRERER